MAISSSIICPITGNIVSAGPNYNNNDDKHALHVLTEELVNARPGGRPFFNPAYGINMNQNVSAGGTPENVHDGLDNTYWTATNAVGSTAVFDAAGAGQTTQGITWTGPSVNDVIQFDKGADFDFSAYATLDLAVYVDRRWTTDEVEIYMYDTGLGIEASDRVPFTPYINELDYDVWQTMKVPIEDFGSILSTADAIRIQYTNRVSNSIEVRFDDIVLQQTGDPIEYKVLVPKGVKFRSYGVRVHMVDAGSVALTNGTVPNLSYDKFYSLSELANGVTFKWVKDGSTVFSRQVRNNFDLQQTGFKIHQAFDDGTNTSISFLVDFVVPIFIPGDSDEYNYISLTINDDLSALTKFTAVSKGSTELE